MGKQNAQGASVSQEVTDAAAKQAATIARNAAEHIKAQQTEDSKEDAPRAKVKIGGKSLVTTELELKPSEKARIQAKCAAGHAAKITAVVKEENKVRVFDEATIEKDRVLVFTGCNGGDYIVSGECVKIFVEKCINCTFRFEGRIVTAVVEIDRCEECNVLIGTAVGTLQVEQCKRMNIVIAKKVLLIGYIIWAGCFTLRVQVGEDLMRCDFELTKGFDPTVNVERTQFKIHYNSLGKLVCDKIIRLKNGFPTTKMEDDEFQRKHEQTLKVMADRMGITIHKKGEKGKQKPNEKCACGSGKKFKKCCKHGRVDAAATAAVEETGKVAVEGDDGEKSNKKSDGK